MLLKEFLKFTFLVESAAVKENNHLSFDSFLSCLKKMKSAIKENNYPAFETAFNDCKQIISTSSFSSGNEVAPAPLEFNGLNMLNSDASSWWDIREQDNSVDETQKRANELNEIVINYLQHLIKQGDAGQQVILNAQTFEDFLSISMSQTEKDQTLADFKIKR